MTNKIVSSALKMGTNPSSFDAVDPAFILSVLNPEEYMAR